MTHPSPPAIVSASHNAFLIRPLRISSAFHPVAARNATGELILRHVIIPAGGGVFRFYLVDAEAPSREPLLIGSLSLEGASTPRAYERLHARVVLDARAQRRLRAASSPAIQISAGRRGGAPPRIQEIELQP